MQNAKCKMQNYLFVLLQIDTKIAIISLISFSMLKYSFSDMYSVLYNSFNQYCVSLASFKAIFIFVLKSGFVCPLCASATFAPILVPLLRSCFYITNSFLSTVRYLYKLTILIEKLKLFSSIALLFNKIISEIILHSAFCILHLNTVPDS